MKKLLAWNYCLKHATEFRLYAALAFSQHHIQKYRKKARKNGSEMFNIFRNKNQKKTNEIKKGRKGYPKTN